jgi:hypothetical protein
MKKVSLYFSFLFLFSSLAFAQKPIVKEKQDPNLGGLDQELRVKNIPLDSILKLNLELNITRYEFNNEDATATAFEYFRSTKLVQDKEWSPSGTYCKVMKNMDSKTAQFLKDSNKFTIPQGSLMKVTETSELEDEIEELHLEFLEPIKINESIEIKDIRLQCKAGVGTWFYSSDEAIHIRGMIYNMGKYISILDHEVAKSIIDDRVVELKTRFPNGIEEVKEKLKNGCTVWTAYSGSPEDTMKDLFFIYFMDSKPYQVIVNNWNNQSGTTDVFVLQPSNETGNWSMFSNAEYKLSPVTALTIGGLRFGYSDFFRDPWFYYYDVSDVQHYIRLTNRDCPE